MSDDILEEAAKRRQRKQNTTKDDDILDIGKVSIENKTNSKSQLNEIEQNIEIGKRERPRTSRRSRTHTSEEEQLLPDEETSVPFVEGKCQGEDVRILLNTSSTLSTMNYETVQFLGLEKQHEKSNAYHQTINGFKISGKIRNIELSLGQEKVHVDVLVVDDGADISLGSQFFRKNQCIINFQEGFLTVHGSKISFLPERDIPLKFRAGRSLAASM